ncbi:MAG: glycoside hydrolase [Gammaproteobacteria bacterium]
MRVVLGWHMHQPDYRDPDSGEYRLPWTYLHAIKDYTDIAAHLEGQPAARAVVNFTPVLLEQIEDYANQIQAYFFSGQPLRDPMLRALASEKFPESPLHRRELAAWALRANRERLIGAYPAYLALAERADTLLADPQAVPDEAFLADLLTWYHLAWMGETVKRKCVFVQELLHQQHAYHASQRRELVRKIGKLIGNVIPRYSRLANAGQVELSMTPYGHPIVPLLIDFDSAREAQPDLLLPEESYPGGVARARWHFEAGLKVFERVFGRCPHGCWPSEGAVSEATLELLNEYGFRWTASGAAVLGHSDSGASLAAAYRLNGEGCTCFFRNDELSDRIGFQYANWHGDDAVANLVNTLESHARTNTENIVTIFLDGENAWEYYPANGFYFLDGLYRALSDHPLLKLTTFSEALEGGVPIRVLPRLIAGSWVYGTFSTWIGSPDKNKGWALLTAAKKVFDRVLQNGRLNQMAYDDVLRRLALCESSDWFWWLGDYNPQEAVADFEMLFRRHLTALYRYLGESPVPELTSVLSRGYGQPSAGGVMRASVDTVE